ncbi:maleylacetoacetate isomerase [Thalassospira sp. NFXS8]|uniref:maleylacetoacetate isomerase n=1 Tax=Thalassospira sp. NFXS8 TaxID=2819093 RepID=UPI0032DF42ED
MKPDDLIFYDYFRSSASYRVRIALNLKGLQANKVETVDLRTGAHAQKPYKSVAPSGLVPSFTFGGKTFGQSLALIEWLDAIYPSPRLIPSEPLAALGVREVAHTIACDIHPLNNLRILKYITGTLSASEEAKLEWYHHWICSGFDTLEALIAPHRDKGPFCLGADVSLADVCLVPQVYNARRFDVDLSPYPAICAVDAHCTTLPGFADAAPEY